MNHLTLYFVRYYFIERQKYNSKTKLSPSLLVFQVNADVFWKILGNSANPSSCEKEFDVSKVAAAGKKPLACVKIPARVKNGPPGFFDSQKSNILARLG